MAQLDQLTGVIHKPPKSHAGKRHVGLTLAILFAVSLLYLSWRGGLVEFLVAAASGTLPALFWLWFWLREDKIHPEPKKAIFKAFFFGALAVPFSILLEQATNFAIRWGACLLYTSPSPRD